MKLITRTSLIALLLFGCVGCDQVTKIAARRYLSGTGVHAFFGDTLRLQYAENPGAFLSLGESLPASLRYLLFTIGVSVLVAALLLWALWDGRLSGLQRLSICAIAAGGLGNLVDRFRGTGRVIDFLNIGLGPVRTGIFNVADMIVMLGLIGLIAVWGERKSGETGRTS